MIRRISRDIMTRTSFFLLFLLLHQTQTAAPQGCNQTLDYVHCPQTWISLGNDLDCRCKINCRGLRLTCLNNGSLERTDFDQYCAVPYRNEGGHKIPSGEMLNISFANNKFTFNCKESWSTETGTAECTANGISVTKYPVCTLVLPRVPGGCKAFDFRCNDGQCIDLYLRCDGDRDCADGSDEDLCGTKIFLAFPERFRCQSVARSLHITQRCDSVKHCRDNSDEAGCLPGVCGVHQYRCANGKCIRGDLVCDDYDSCGDNSDEIYCSRIAYRIWCPAWRRLCDKNKCVETRFACNVNRCTNRTHQKICKSRGKCKYINEGQCQNSKCVYHSQFCDNSNDCGDNSDEINCNISQTVCPSNEFLCDNGMCVPLSAKCDGKNHCGDGSDEWNCSKPADGCKQCEFSCVRTGQCIPWKARCDGLFHCTDGSDEWADACSAKVPAGCSDVPVCHTSTAGLNCGAEEFVQINESRICICLNTCRSVQVTCLTNGSWSQSEEQCSRPLQICSNTVVSCFNNGKYNFKCVNGFKQIGGNSTAICENGQLKFSEKLNCEKFTKDDFVTTWIIMGTGLLFFAILHVAIGVYCYRKDNQMFAAWENIAVSEPTASTSGTVELRNHPI